jgi:hypothetical protein
MPTISFNAENSEITLGTPKHDGGPQDALNINTLPADNNSSGTEVETYNFTYTKSADVTYSLTQTLGISVTAEVTADVEGVASAELSATMSLDLSATESKTTSVSRQYSVSDSLTLLPYTRGLFYTELREVSNATIPFTARIEISCESGDKVLAGKKVEELVKNLLQNSTKIIKVNDDCIVIETSGNITAPLALELRSYAISVPLTVQLEPNQASVGSTVNVIAPTAEKLEGDYVRFIRVGAEAESEVFYEGGIMKVLVPNLPAGPCSIELFNETVGSDASSFTING